MASVIRIESVNIYIWSSLFLVICVKIMRTSDKFYSDANCAYHLHRRNLPISNWPLLVSVFLVFLALLDNLEILLLITSRVVFRNPEWARPCQTGILHVFTPTSSIDVFSLYSRRMNTKFLDSQLAVRCFPMSRIWQCFSLFVSSQSEACREETSVHCLIFAPLLLLRQEITGSSAFCVNGIFVKRNLRDV